MKRKGVTPVIAVVLLLLITVGAVVSAWGLYQQIAGDQSQLDDLNQQQKAQNTKLVFDSVWTDNNDIVNVRIRNTGSEPVHLYDDVRLHLKTDAVNQYVSLQDLVRSNIDDSDYTAGDDDCFDSNADTTIGVDEEMTCATGYTLANAGKEVQFRLSYRNVEGYNWDFSCELSSSSASLC